VGVGEDEGSQFVLIAVFILAEVKVQVEVVLLLGGDEVFAFVVVVVGDLVRDASRVRVGSGSESEIVRGIGARLQSQLQIVVVAGAGEQLNPASGRCSAFRARFSTTGAVGFRSRTWDGCGLAGRGGV
jgi:hypothetical protein